MFLKKVTIKKDDKIYNYYKIVVSYRDEDGKPKHRLVQNLGVLSDKDAARMKMILQVQKDTDLLVTKSTDITVTRHWIFLPIIVLHSLWELFRLDRFFTNALLVEAMVINRCIDPMSKIHVVDWMQRTVLPALQQISIFPDDYAVYRELDALNKRESDLQIHLYQLLKQIDPTVGEGFFYDITSTYMEGSKCIISKFGYSRDHRPDREQIVIALMVTPQGSPFYWKVLDGNTQDITTLPNVIRDLEQRFRLKSCHLVFDRGMVSADHLKLLEIQGITYLSAMDKDEMVCHSLFDKFVPEPMAVEDYEQTLLLHEFQPTDDNQFFYTREGQIGERRFIFSFDVCRFFEDISSREKRINQAINWIIEKNTSLSMAKKSRNQETLLREIKQMLAKRKLKSLLQVSITPIEIQVTKKDGNARMVQSFHLSASVDKAKEINVRRKDGITCFITNEITLSAAQVIQKYRDKNKIEEAFREMKSQLALRPIHLTRSERVKAHVSVCMLAYLLLNTMEMMLKAENCLHSPMDIIRQMKSCQLNEVGFKNSPQRSITMTEMTSEQQQWLKQLQCEKYIKPKRIKMITEFLQKML